MTESNNRQSKQHDRAQDVIDAIEKVELKALSYTELRRLYAIVMQAVDDVNEELTRRKEQDNDGDTVRIPVPAADPSA